MDPLNLRRQTLFQRISRVTGLCFLCAFATFALTLVFMRGCECERRTTHKIESNQKNEKLKPNATRDKRPKTLDALTPEALLRETFNAYANAKYYSDRGYVEILCSDPIVKTRIAYRAPCSAALCKPNYFCARLGKSMIQSNGKTLSATIDVKEFANRRLERPAPLVVASIREFYPDAQFAERANLGVATRLFWTSPQLVLLFAKDPRKTLIPTGSKLKLLPPEYLKFDVNNPNAETIVCDRLLVESADGARVFWIDRAKKTLARCELPVEGTASPDENALVDSIRIDFPDQKIADVASDDLSEFLSKPQEGVEIVERFLPIELEPLGKIFPKEALTNIDASKSNQRTDDPSSRNFTLLYFWGSNATKPTLNARQAFEEASRYGYDPSQIRFEPIYCGSSESFNLNDLPSTIAPLTSEPRKFDRERAKELEPAFARIEAPSFLLLDAEGRAIKYIRSGFSLAELRRLLGRAIDGRDLIADDFNAYNEGVRRFTEFIERSDQEDLYRLSTDFNEPISPPRRQYPKTFGLRECWRYEGLCAPSNPLPIEAREGRKPDIHEDAIDRDGFRRAYVEHENGKKITVQQSYPPEELLIVPCDGNALALFDSSGRLLRKTTPIAALGEPINFVRVGESRDGRRFYAASARCRSRKVHRFDEQFNDLGSLDVGRASDQWVADALFADCDEDGTPELVVSLLSDRRVKSEQIDGIYAVNLEDQRIVWRFESLLTPEQLALYHPNQGDENKDDAPRLLALDRLKGTIGTIAQLRLKKGDRIGEIRPVNNDSVRSFAFSSTTNPKNAQIAAIVTRPTSNRAALVGLNLDGDELWEYQTQAFIDSQMERLSVADFNNDGRDEWIAASPDGTILFINEKGAPIDAFQYGKEITGARVVNWSTGTYLILCDLNSVSAWKIESRADRAPMKSRAERFFYDLDFCQSDVASLQDSSVNSERNVTP